LNFNLTEEQLMLQIMVKDFTEREVEPLSSEIEQNNRLPDDLIKKLASLGLFGMAIPEKYGGSGTGNISCILAVEQLAYSGTPAWWLVGFNNSIPECINHFGSEEIKQKYLPPLCNGSAVASIQFTEEDTGSDPDALITTSEPDGDYYIINGMKRFSTFGARNGYAVTYTKDETGKCTAFITEKNTEGYTAPKVWDLMGAGGIEAADVYFENYRAPKENLLGTKGEGLNALLYWIAIEKLEQCAASVGIAQAALDEAVTYANSRMVRGKPMGSMQGIRWMLADAHVKIEAARWMTYRATFLQDQGARNWQTEAAAAKIFVVPAAMEAVELARRIHGGYGYARDFKIDRLYRAVCGASAIAVSLEINKTIVGASVLK